MAISGDFKINEIELTVNPKYSGQTHIWGQRDLSRIKKIINHQQLAEGTTVATNNYHISEDSHLKKGGAPKIAYHYTIEKDGTVYKVNDHTDVVWHCAGQNTTSIGIMLCGDFTGPGHVGKSEPTKAQLGSLRGLLNHLTKELTLPRTSVYGHCDFGKPACPGNIVMDLIKEYRGDA